MYLITAYFDEKATRQLERYLNRIAEKTGNDFMAKHNVPPHLTITSIEARSERVLQEPFQLLQGQLSSGKIKFVSIGQLLPYVFYTTPVLNDYLQQLSRSVYDVFEKIPETNISKYYRPGSWLPHVTLGKTLTKEQMRGAFEGMQEYFQPFEAKIIALGLSKVNPHEDVVRFSLKNEQ